MMKIFIGALLEHMRSRAELNIPESEAAVTSANGGRQTTDDGRRTTMATATAMPYGGRRVAMGNNSN
jgi:hypothetical protein